MIKYGQYLAFLLMAFASAALGASTKPLSYGGRLTSADGTPVSGKINLSVSFFTSQTGGSLLGTVDPTTLADVQLKDGVFNVDLLLDDGDLNDIFSDVSAAVWIEIKDLTHNKPYPRQRFSTIPYALKVPIDGNTLEFNSIGQLQIKTPDAGTSGDVLTTDGAGHLSWQAQTGGSGGGEPVIAPGTTAQFWRGDKTWQSIATTNVSEGTNLYFTPTRAKTAAVTDSLVGGATDVAPSQAAVATALAGKETSLTAGTTAQYLRGDKTWQTLSTLNVAENTNLYYTDVRARAATVATTITNGVTTSAPSQDAVFDALALKEGALSAGTTAQYLSGDKTWKTLDTSAVPEGTNQYFTTARAKVAAVADTIVDGVIDVAPSQNVVFDQLALKQSSTQKNAANGYPGLDGSGKLSTAVLPYSTLTYKGTWNATTNVPDLTTANCAGYATGDYFIISAAGATSLNGTTSWSLGDWTICGTGLTWQRLANMTGGGSISTVNGLTGSSVTLTTDNVNEGTTNKYFTSAAAKTAAVADALNNGTIDVAPSQNVVFDALATKEPAFAAGTTAQFLRGDKTWQTPSTDNVVEGANLYFTTARAKTAAVTNSLVGGATDVAASQAVVATALAGKEGSIAGGTTAQYLRGDKTWQVLDTAGVPENGSLYFTTARAKTAAVADALVDNTTDVAPSQNAVFDALATKEPTVASGTTAQFYRGDKTWQAVVADSLTDGVTAVAPSQNAVFDALAAKASSSHYHSSLDGAGGSPASALVVDSSGNVGVGTSSPSQRLDVRGGNIEAYNAGASVFTYLSTKATSTSGSPHILLQRARGTTIGGESAVQSGDSLGALSFRGHNGTALSANGNADIRAYAEENFTPSAYGSSLRFHTTAIGTSTLVERVRISDSGNVGVGTTSPQSLVHVVSAASANVIVEGGSGNARTTHRNTATGLTATDGFMVGTTSTGNAQVWNFDNSFLQIATNNTERIRVDAAGNVGIGTTNPAYIFEINQDVNAVARMNFTNPNVGNAAKVQIDARNDAGTAAQLGVTGTGFTPSGAAVANEAFVQANGTGASLRVATVTAQPIRFAPNNVERARLDTNGNLGIGTTNPAFSLDVSTTGAVRFGASSAVANYSLLRMYNPDTTDGNGNQIMFSTNTTGAGATTDFGLSGIRGVNSVHDHATRGGELAFLTSDASNPLERVRISKDGNVGIGTTTPDTPLSVSGTTGAPLRLHRQTSVANSVVGVMYSANNSTPVTKSYAATYGIIEDSTAGSENGSFRIDTVTNSTVSEKLRVTSAGNVGIGTTIPTAKLEVAGDIKTSSSGKLLAGYIAHRYSTNSVNNRAACPAGTAVLNGGCVCALGQIFVSYPSTESTDSNVQGTLIADGGTSASSWTCGCASANAGNVANVMCARIGN